MTLSQGDSATGPGDTLFLLDGTYAVNNFTFTASGSSEGTRPIIKSLNFRGATIQCGAEEDNDRSLSFSGDWIQLENFRIQHCDSGLVAQHIRFVGVEFAYCHGNCMTGGDANFLELINTYLHHAGMVNDTDWYEVCEPGGSGSGDCHGAYVGMDDVLFDGGEWTTAVYAIHCRFTCTRWVVRNVTFRPNPVKGGGAIIFQAGGTNRVYNNLFVGQNNQAIFTNSSCTGTSCTEIYNNTFSNVGIPILVEESETIARNNLYINSGGNQINSGTLTQSNNLSVNPACVENFAGNDLHLIHFAGCGAINGGTSGSGVGSIVTVDRDGHTRPFGPAYDIGAYECQSAPGSGDDCFGDIVEPPPPPCTDCLLVEHKASGVDTSVNAFPDATLTGGTLTNGAPLTSNNTTSLVFDGINDAMIEANDPAFRSASFCMTVWVNTTTVPASGGFCRMISLGVAGVLGWNELGEIVGYLNDGAAVVNSIGNVADGATHLIGVGFGGGMLKGWKDNANFDSESFAGTVNYVGNEQLTYGGVSGKYCGTRANNFRFFNTACTPAIMATIYAEVISTSGTSSTKWRFYQADAPENTQIAGQDVNAPSIVVNRSSKTRHRENVKRNGSMLNQYFQTECSLNSLTAFTTITNSCAVNPVCIAADSVKNMGDPTANLLPNDGFNFTPGRFTVDTINAGLTTTIPDGGVSEMEKSYAFNQSLADQAVVRCRLVGMDTYPPTLPTIIISVPTPTAGSNLQGGMFQGVTMQ